MCSLDKLVEASVHPSSQLTDVVDLLRVYCFVTIDERQIRLWCDVGLASEPGIDMVIDNIAYSL